MSKTEINPVCAICNKFFIKTNKKIVTCRPCEHLIHEECYNDKYLQCKICNSSISEIISEDKLSENDQIFNDIKSIKKRSTDFNYFSIILLILRIPMVFIIFIIFSILDITWLLENKHARSFLIRLSMYTCGYKITVHNKEKLNDINKIYVINHHCLIDPFIAYSVKCCVGIASTSILNSFLKRSIANRLRPLYVSRGKTDGILTTTEKICNYIDTTGSLGIFPQGTMIHEEYLSPFRTGAFVGGKTVQPIIIKYNKRVHGLSMFDLLKYWSVNVDVIVLDTIDNTTVETTDEVFDLMFENGNFKLSRISNRAIKD